MKAIIRPFAVKDARSLVAAIDVVCAEGRWMCTWRYEPTPAWEHAFNVADCANHLLLVVDDGAQIAGWCRTFPVNGPGGAGTTASLGVGLLPGYRNRGLGTTLVQTSLDWANETGVSRVTLTTRPDNRRAIHVFYKCGFTLTDNGPDGIIEMSTELGEKSHARF